MARADAVAKSVNACAMPKLARYANDKDGTFHIAIFFITSDCVKTLLNISSL